MWTAHQDCIDIVRSCWNNFVPGCPMFVLGQKLKTLKEQLKIWNKVNFGNITANVKAATDRVDEIQMMIDINGASDALLDQEKLAQINLENVLHMEELFWSEKSKVKWHLEGDRNTAYFHRIAKIKNTTNHISSLMNGDIALNSTDEISAHVVDYFSSLLHRLIILLIMVLWRKLSPILLLIESITCSLLFPQWRKSNLLFSL
jgi:hypothetical protein